MDPISITTSAITLIQLAGTVKTSLQRLAQTVKKANERIDELCNELASLTTRLEAVDRTLKGCRPFDTAYMDKDLWHQSELCIEDCRLTLGELQHLVDKIKDKTQSQSIGARIRRALNLTAYSPELISFRDKIHQSNWALQTLLHTINVSISLRNHASQETILFQLDRLKVTIDDAVRVTARPSQGFRHYLSSDTHVSPNFSPSRRERVASYIRSTAYDIAADNAIPQSVGATPAPGDAAVHHAVPNTSSYSETVRGVGALTVPRSSGQENNIKNDEDDEDEKVEFEKLFLTGLEDLAKDSIQKTKFEQAIDFLTKAIRRSAEVKARPDIVHRLHMQLALCYLFLNDWMTAEPIILTLAANEDLPMYLGPAIWTMLHAIALGYLSTYQFNSAINICQKAYEVQKKWAKAACTAQSKVRGFAEMTGLLVIIHRMQGDYIAAEIYARRLPKDMMY
ncbi:hypothetical protein VTH82DRAFT_6140 [Thermothelomyces myriococcoides]